MKNFTQIICISLLVISNLSAQQEKGIVGIVNWLNNWSEFNPKVIDYGDANQIISGSITEDTKLYKKYTYMLLGSVNVTNNATLTIEPGTVIIGDYKSKASLTISKGATIIADGEETDPIVFTSNRSVKKAGDWGGLILLGDAPVNKFGGEGSITSLFSETNISSSGNRNYGGINPVSNSGILRYVRIEYAGSKIKGGKNFSGLLLAGVGSYTILENIMISYSAGNSFEVIGGEVNLYEAVSFRSKNNDYKFNFGTQAQLLNSLAVRSPYVSSNKGARCVFVVSYNKKEEVDFTKNLTLVVAKNLTLINDSKDLKADINLGLVKEAVYIGKNASLYMNKSVITGFNPAVLLEDGTMVNQQNLEKVKFTNMYFNNCEGNIFVENNSNNEDLENWYGNSFFFNVYSKSLNSETFIDLDNKKSPDFRLRINKIIATTD